MNKDLWLFVCCAKFRWQTIATLALHMSGKQIGNVLDDGSEEQNHWNSMTVDTWWFDFLQMKSRLCCSTWNHKKKAGRWNGLKTHNCSPYFRSQSHRPADWLPTIWQWQVTREKCVFPGLLWLVAGGYCQSLWNCLPKPDLDRPQNWSPAHWQMSVCMPWSFGKWFL